MKRLLLASTLLLMLSGAGGCVFFGGDDDPCYVFEADAIGYRNPVSGACEFIGGGGGGGCGGYGDDGDIAEPAPEPGALPDWAICPGLCEELDEATCLVTSACRAAYLEDGCPPGADCAPSPSTFLGCWGTSQSGPIQGGGCGGLDAWECSRHDDCTAHYTGDGGTGEQPGFQLATVFSYCADEAWGPGCYSDLDCPAGWQCTADTACDPLPGCTDGNGDAECPPGCYGRCEPAQGGCEAVDCGPGSHCELQCAPCESPEGEMCDYPCAAVCVPDEPSGCEAILCGPGTTCETVCEDLICPPGEACPSMCWSACVPDGADPGTCTGDVWCDAIPPSCPAGTVAGIANGCWSGFCIPEAKCGPSDPGGCETADCALAAPDCPVDTVPGVRDGCFTGYCIPAWTCEPDTSCAALTDEASCTARTDCQPLFDGAGCTCYPDGSCTCEEWEFLRCTTAGDPPVMPF